MPPAAGAVAQSDRVGEVVMPTTPVMMSETFAKDAIIAWFRGEFAAANAIIDALCSHLTQLEGGVVGRGSEYESVFAAIHRRRLNWIPILQMQKYYSIADVALELRKVAAKKAEERKISAEEVRKVEEEMSFSEKEKSPELCVSEEDIIPEDIANGDGGHGEVVDEDSAKDDSPESEITDTGK